LGRQTDRETDQEQPADLLQATLHPVLAQPPRGLRHEPDQDGKPGRGFDDKERAEQQRDGFDRAAARNEAGKNAMKKTPAFGLARLLRTPMT
jgi:hypothetical protein